MMPLISRNTPIPLSASNTTPLHNVSVDQRFGAKGIPGSERNGIAEALRDGFTQLSQTLKEEQEKTRKQLADQHRQTLSKLDKANQLLKDILQWV